MEEHHSDARVSLDVYNRENETFIIAVTRARAAGR
jgi:hypothetical protein